MLKLCHYGLKKTFQKNLLFNKLKEHDENYKSDSNIFFSDHHLSHAAKCFFPSPFDEAVVLTADGVGEWATTTVAIGKMNDLEIKKEIHFPHSLGLLYSAFTYYTGFKVNSGEYKLMGLAPYGNPIYVDKVKELIDLKDDGTFRLDQTYFNYATGLTMTSKKFNNLFGQKPRNPQNENITQFHMDIAASIQKVTEEIIISLAKSIRKEYGIKNLCLAGGVALNCVANGKILEEKILIIFGYNQPLVMREVLWEQHWLFGILIKEMKDYLFLKIICKVHIWELILIKMK